MVEKLTKGKFAFVFVFHNPQKKLFMKMTNTLCSTSCSSYSEMPEPGFYLCTINAGTTYVIEPDDTNRMLFLRVGRFSISSVESTDYLVKASHMVFCSRSYIYTIEALEDCEILVARFVSANVTVEGETYRTIAADVSKVAYRFAAVMLNDVLGNFADTVAHYLKSGINNMAMHRAKMEELFVVFRHFYPREVYLRTFYSLFNNTVSFRSLVVSNAPNAKNVEALARMCGHSLSHFKLLFGQHFNETPYVWMQQQRAVEIAKLLADSSLPLRSIIKSYGFTSHGHFSLFCRKFLGDTPKALRRKSNLPSAQEITIEDIKRNMDRSRTVTLAKKKEAEVSTTPRRRGRPRKVQA